MGCSGEVQYLSAEVLNAKTQELYGRAKNAGLWESNGDRWVSEKSVHSFVAPYVGRCKPLLNNVELRIGADVRLKSMDEDLTKRIEPEVERWVKEGNRVGTSAPPVLEVRAIFVNNV